MSDAPFLYDDFFASDADRGVVIPVRIKGRDVPITIRRGLSIADRHAAEAAAVKKRLVPGKGLVIEGVDESRAADELVVRAILAWPFVFRDGSPVPITHAHVARLLGGNEAILAAIQTIDEQGEAALAPFAPASDAP